MSDDGDHDLRRLDEIVDAELEPMHPVPTRILRELRPSQRVLNDGGDRTVDVAGKVVKKVVVAKGRLVSVVVQ